MSVKEGRVVLPDGMSYRVLVLPEQHHMPLEVLVKLEQLVSGGAAIIGPKPLEVPGLKGHEQRTQELRELADKMWGPCDGMTVKQNRYGRGQVVWGLNARQWLTQRSVGPDFSCQPEAQTSQLDYIHCRTGDADIYFVRNKSLEPVAADCLFRVKGRAPQLWDPADGSTTPVLTYQAVNGGTRLPLDMPPGGSVFVVFDQHGLNNAKKQVNEIKPADLPAPRVLGGEWTVAFDPDWGAPAEVTLPKLMSWTEHENEGVKYYSGAAFYTKTLNVPADWLASGRQVYLDLGDVREVAEVFVNGYSAGVLWKPPFRTEITRLVKPGANALKIEVMNMWINRLTGDMNLPAEKQFTRTNVKSGGLWRGEETWKIEPAGLLGPVRLLPSVAPKSLNTR